MSAMRKASVYRTKLGGMDLPALGMGCLRLPTVGGGDETVDERAAQELVDACMAHGVDLFDTAYTYLEGNSERFLGKALARYPRESYQLSSKYYVVAGDDIEAIFEEQLRRLRTDYFDYYLFHGLDENYIDDYTDPGRDYLGYLLRQKELGRIRHLGFSSHAGVETLERFCDFYEGFEFALVQLNYVDWELLQAREQYEALVRRGLAVWAMEPLKGGRLARLDGEAARILQQADPRASHASWGLRFASALPGVAMVLSGMSSLEQLERNAALFERPRPLDASESAALEQARDAFAATLGIPCSSCRYCTSVCPQQLDIPLYMQACNELRASGETWRLAVYETRADAGRCIECGACSERCPQHIDIPAAMRELAAAR